MKRGRLPVAVRRGRLGMTRVPVPTYTDLHHAGALAEFNVEFHIPGPGVTIATLNDRRKVIDDDTFAAIAGLPTATFEEALEVLGKLGRRVQWREAGEVHAGRDVQVIATLLELEPTAACPVSLRLMRDAVCRLVGEAV